VIFLFYLFIFILGSSVGSFLGVIVDRLSSKESIWKGRSHCDHCRHILGALDLFPIFSFLLLGGKCRYCHKKLSWFYPSIEICTAIVYIAASFVVFAGLGQLVLQSHDLFLFSYYLILSSALIVIFFTDLRYGIIPFNAVAVALCVTILWYFLSATFGQPINIVAVIASALGAGGFFLLLFIFTKGRGMGFGDVVYAFLMGFTLGFPGVFLGLYLAFVTGAIVSLLLVAIKKKKFKGGTIPFGPFLVFGTLVTLLWGNQLFSFIVKYLTF
jgi:prepilin signal peptidase PulO-like enzyme (type II secretory pathway)